LQVIARREEVEQTRCTGTKGYQKDGYDDAADGHMIWDAAENMPMKGWSSPRGLGLTGLGRKNQFDWLL